MPARKRSRKSVLAHQVPIPGGHDPLVNSLVSENQMPSGLAARTLKVYSPEAGWGIWQNRLLPCPVLLLLYRTIHHILELGGAGVTVVYGDEAEGERVITVFCTRLRIVLILVLWVMASANPGATLSLTLISVICIRGILRY